MEEEEESMEALTKAMHSLSRTIDEIKSIPSYLVTTCEVCGMRGHTRNFCQSNTPYYPNQAPYWDGNFHYTTNYSSNKIPKYNPYPSTYNSDGKIVLIFPTKTTHLHHKNLALKLPWKLSSPHILKINNLLHGLKRCKLVHAKINHLK